MEAILEHLKREQWVFDHLENTFFKVINIASDAEKTDHQHKFCKLVLQRTSGYRKRYYSHEDVSHLRLATEEETLDLETQLKWKKINRTIGELHVGDIVAIGEWKEPTLVILQSESHIQSVKGSGQKIELICTADNRFDKV